MPERIRHQRTTDHPTEEGAPATSDAARVRTEKIRDELDELLDEIDDVLEENAEEFVRNYVQKGGE